MYNNKKIGVISKNYRIVNMNLTQQELSDLTGISIKNISAFETGRANNINYVLVYAKLGGLKYLETIYNECAKEVK